MRALIPILCVALLQLISSSVAQQWAGETIPNTLPKVTGAQVAFFNVHDANGGNTTLINYYSSPAGKAQNQTNVKRAVIVLAGKNRNAWDYFGTVRGRISAATALNKEVTEQTVAIFSPHFANADDKGVSYPFNASAPVGSQSDTSVLVWPDYFWYQGSTNIYPSSQQTVSSFEALDQVILWFANPANFPNLNEIVIAGHSMGGQMAQRYAIVGKQLGLPIPLTYWIGNPDAFGWLNSSRPVAPGTCKIFDNWSQGLSGYGTGQYTYNAGAFATNSADSMRANYATRRLAYARALADFGDASEDCSPFSQGGNRGERFFSFLTYFPPNSLCTVDYVANTTHDATKMMADVSGLQRIFLDNWSGNGTRAPDYGARQVTGDDPHPTANGIWNLP